MMQDIRVLLYMKNHNIKNSADMFLYKSLIDLNSAKYLLKAFNEDLIEKPMSKVEELK